MADPVAIVEKIVKLGLQIKVAVDTVRYNEEECEEIKKRVLRFSAILSQLQQTGMMNDNPEMSGTLEDLEESLQHALELVTDCQETSAIRRLFTAGDLAKQLRRVNEDISKKVELASFAINIYTPAGGHPHPPPRQPEDAGLVETSHSSQSTNDDPRSELNDVESNVLAGSEASFAASLAGCIKRWKHCRLPSRKIGPVLIGFSIILNFFLLFQSFNTKLKRKKGRAIESGPVLVEEYLPNGSLQEIIQGSRDSKLDWSALFWIIEGVAQGLHYLHEQGVVHMDVKPGNILLDSNMNAIITDFEISAVLDDNDEMTTDMLAGTLGFVAPEHFLQSIVSAKNDVFAFGILLLKTVGSLRRCSDSRNPEELWMIRYDRWAWKAWDAGRIEEEFDPSLFDGSHELTAIKRCVEVGLLCTQQDRQDRPTMADVLEMLHGRKELPDPKMPSWWFQEDSD